MPQVHTQQSNLRGHLRAQLIDGELRGTGWATRQQHTGQAATLSWLLKSWPKFIDAYDETEATRRAIKSMLTDMIRTRKTPKASKSAALEGRWLYAEELELLERHLDMMQRQPCPPAAKKAAHQAPSGGRKKRKLAWEDEVTELPELTVAEWKAAVAEFTRGEPQPEPISFPHGYVYPQPEWKPTAGDPGCAFTVSSAMCEPLMDTLYKARSTLFWRRRRFARIIVSGFPGFADYLDGEYTMILDENNSFVYINGHPVWECKKDADNSFSFMDVRPLYIYYQNQRFRISHTRGDGPDLAMLHSETLLTDHDAKEDVRPVWQYFVKGHLVSERQRRFRKKERPITVQMTCGYDRRRRKDSDSDSEDGGKSKKPAARFHTILRNGQPAAAGGQNTVLTDKDKNTASEDSE